MVSRLKICGITNQADALACVKAGVDMLGFNFYRSSPRFIPVPNACSIIDLLPSTVTSVGILVRPTLEEVLTIIATSGVNTVQLYEPQDIMDYSKIPVPVIIAYHVSDRFPGNIHNLFSDMILIDSFAADKMGGSGQVFDWSTVPDFIPRERLVLAGGINPDNIFDALHQVNPAVIDVASGAEIFPGKKDIAKVTQLVEAVKIYNKEKSRYT